MSRQGSAGSLKKRDPATLAMRAAVTQLRYLCNALGLSPGARGRMGVTEEHQLVDEGNPFAGGPNPFD